MLVFLGSSQLVVDNKQYRFCNSAERHGLDGRKDTKMFGSGWRTFNVCNIQKLVQVNKPQDFSFRLVYEEFVISDKLYKHYLFFVLFTRQ